MEVEEDDDRDGRGERSIVSGAVCRTDGARGAAGAGRRRGWKGEKSGFEVVSEGSRLFVELPRRIGDSRSSRTCC